MRPLATVGIVLSVCLGAGCAGEPAVRYHIVSATGKNSTPLPKDGQMVFHLRTTTFLLTPEGYKPDMTYNRRTGIDACLMTIKNEHLGSLPTPCQQTLKHPTCKKSQPLFPSALKNNPAECLDYVLVTPTPAAAPTAYLAVNGNTGAFRSTKFAATTLPSNDKVITTVNVQYRNQTAAVLAKVGGAAANAYPFGGAAAILAGLTSLAMSPALQLEAATTPPPSWLQGVCQKDRALARSPRPLRPTLPLPATIRLYAQPGYDQPPDKSLTKAKWSCWRPLHTYGEAEGQFSGWLYRVTLKIPPQPMGPQAFFKSASTYERAKASDYGTLNDPSPIKATFPVPLCVTARLEIVWWRYMPGLGQQPKASHEFSHDYQIAYPMYLKAVPLPRTGSISIGTADHVCGGYPIFKEYTGSTAQSAFDALAKDAFDINTNKP